MKLNDFIDAQLEIEAKATKGDWHTMGDKCLIASEGEPIMHFAAHYPLNTKFICSARNNYRPLLLALKVTIKKIKGEHYCGEPGVECEWCELEQQLKALLLAQQEEK